MKNEDAISKSFSMLQYVHEVFHCGLFEAKDHPWLAASPDGFALFDLPGLPGSEDEQFSRHFGSLEIKARVLPDRISKAEEIAVKYNNKHTICSIGDETWMDCVERTHHIQVMVQQTVLNIRWCVYIVGQPGAIEEEMAE
jgi:hypothetical protein